MKAPKSFQQMLKNQGYSGEVIEELWKWYDYSEKKGIASYWIHVCCKPKLWLKIVYLDRSFFYFHYCFLACRWLKEHFSNIGVVRILHKNDLTALILTIVLPFWCPLCQGLSTSWTVSNPTCAHSPIAHLCFYIISKVQQRVYDLRKRFRKQNSGFTTQHDRCPYKCARIGMMKLDKRMKKRIYFIETLSR